MALTPERIAELERLKAMMREPAAEAQRKAQAIFNAEKGAGQPVKLPTDHKSKGGLEKFLEPSAEKRRAYHGTPNNFSYFAENPTYVSFDPKFASDYGLSRTEGVEYVPEETAQGASVMPVHVQVANPFDYDNRKHVLQLLRKLRQRGQKHFTKNDLHSGSFEILEDPTVFELMKKLGHDAFYVNEGYGDPRKNLGVFDANKIKSAIGNRGTYDTKERDITKAKGGQISQDAMQLALMNKKPAHLAIGGQGPRNWMKGVDEVINPLKVKVRTEGINGHTKQNTQSDEAINKWIQGNMTNYIRKQMSSPDDPIRNYADKRSEEIEAKHAKDLERIQKVIDRAQAEADPRKKENLIRQSAQMRNEADHERSMAMDHILHMANDQMGTGQYLANGLEEPDIHRRRHGGERMGKSEAAQAWEDATDVSLGKTTVGDVLRMGQTSAGKHHVEPWMEKADPKTEMFHPTDNMHAHYLGFDHIVDILKQDLAEGRITPEQLNKVSIEQAVRRAAEYNQERTKAMQESKLKRDEGMPVHTDYGDGNKWIELAFDKNLPEGWTKNPNGTFTGPDGKTSIHHPNRDKLEDALKYEGDTMGHCVGGYTDRVMRGDSRIYSLRDKRNEPHVTIEVTKAQPRTSYEEMNAIYRQADEEANAQNFDTHHKRDHFYQDRVKELQYALLDKKADEMPPKIQQIYGKSNKKPKKEYIPFVQDFVKKGEWSDVLTAHNAEVVPAGENKYVSEAEAKAHYEPRVKKALHFLSNHPAFQEQHAAKQKRDKELLDLDEGEQRKLESISGRSIYPGSGYSAPELLRAIKNPEEHIGSLNEYYPSMNSWLNETEKAIAHHGDVPQVIKKAQGGNVQLTIEQMRQQLMAAGKGLPDISQIGANEAPNMPTKAFVIPENGAQGPLPMGGVDMSPQQPGQQMLPANAMQPNPLAPQQPPTGPAPQGGGSNILQMTPQGQKMAALGGSPQGNLPPPKMAVGGPVPVQNHPFMSAGDRPMPFMAKEGGSNDAPMNNDYSDNGATDFSIDNIQQLAGGGNVQGYASKGYVHHTDINPHPEAGKRFKAEQLSGLMPEFPVDMNELYNQRASLQLRPWDSTSRHVKVTNVSGHDLDKPLITEGGQGFARDIELQKEGIAGASGKEIQGRIQSRANAAHEENIKQGGRGHTYDIIANMDKVAPLFTSMPLHVQLEFLKRSGLSPAQMEHIVNRIRNKKIQKKTPFTNLLPLDHPDSMKQLTESGAMRKAVSEELASKTNQKLLDYNLEDLLAAVTVPEIHAAPAGYAGNTFIANVPHAGLGPKRHSVYDTSGYGDYAGKGAQVPAELYMADTFEKVSRELQKQFPKAGASAIRAMTIGALQTRKGNVSQMVNDRVMKNLERFHEGVKKGNIQNPNDLYGVLGHFYKEHGGYKEGGGVKKPKVTDNLDTMRLALTRNTKAK